MAKERSRNRLPFVDAPEPRARRTDPRHSAGGVGPDIWRSTIHQRVLVIATVLVVWTLAIVARLVFLQVFQHDALQERAERQQLRTITAPAKRGEILDRHGRVLAVSVDGDAIYAVPTEIEDAHATAALLCEALDHCDDAERITLATRLGARRAFAYVRRQASPDETRRIAELGLEGVGFLKESRRYYPNREIAAHVLGYAGIDNQGLHGVEFTYDQRIRGRPGKILIQTDARRRAFSRVERPPTAGAAIELTIDRQLQYIAERELRRGIAEQRASGGTVIIMDPRSGEILALANEPTFNPNAFAKSGAAARRNRALQDIYEPGSTFKIVTASAALQEEVVAPDDPIDVSAGMIRFGGRRIDDEYRYGVLSFSDVVIKSSNVGAIKVGLRLGSERLGRYVRRFGFGQRLSPDLMGESAGIVWDFSTLTDSALASVAMGYQIGVTPLQMVTAVSAVANGGELLEPRVVRAVLYEQRRVERSRRVIRQAITPRTAAALTTIMEGVVDRGTARSIRVDGYRVAGKTGTAAKLVDGRYSTTDYNSSFVGFLPSRKPVLTILVVIDTPRAGAYYGGAVAGPVFKRVADAAVRHMGIAPTIDPAPRVVARRWDQAQLPLVRTGARAPEVRTAAATLAPGQRLMPDLTGMSARQAVRALAGFDVRLRFDGTGVVEAQHPQPGAAIDRGVECSLQLSRAGARADVRAAPDEPSP